MVQALRCPPRPTACEQSSGKVALSGHPGHSDHVVVEFKTFGDRRKTVTKTSTLDMERTDFRLLGELVSKVRW